MSGRPRGERAPRPESSLLLGRSRAGQWPLAGPRPLAARRVAGPGRLAEPRPLAPACAGSSLSAARTPHRAAGPGLLHALRDYLVAPAADGEVVPHSGRSGAAPALGPTVAVIADAADVAAVAAAVALLVARRSRAPCAVVMLHGERRPAVESVVRTAAGSPSPGGRVLGTPTARRVGASLAWRGLPVRVAGRLVVVTLPAAGGSETVAASQRALDAAAAAGAVAVAGLGGARDPALDRVIGACDLALAVVRPCREGLLALAVDGLAALGVPARDGGPARVLARGGLGVPPALRTALAPSLEPWPERAWTTP